jgi:site-specific DNA-methyltransferase (adenine-specific)
MFPVNEVLQGDCTRVLRRLPDSFVDLVVTDPPYGVRYQDSIGRTIANDDDPSRILCAFTDLHRVLKPDSICISFYGWGQVDTFFRAWRRAGFRPAGHIVWVKDYASRTRYLHYRHEQAYVLAKGSPKMPEQPIDDIQPWVYSGNPDHPTQKAVQILTPLMEAFSQPGQLVLDPFAGSGSTLVAAAISGRRYLGIELEQGYCCVARERLARVRTRLSQLLPTQAGLDQEELDLVPADVDGFIQWLREHRMEGVARVVESAKAEYGW